MSSYIGKVVASGDRPLKSGDGACWRSGRIGTFEQAQILMQQVVAQNRDAGIPASGEVVVSSKPPEIFTHCGTSPQAIGGICAGCGRKLTLKDAKAFAKAQPPRRKRGVVFPEAEAGTVVIRDHDAKDATIWLDNSDLTGDHTPISLAALIELNQYNGSGGFPESEIAAMRSLRVGESANLESGSGYTTVVRVLDLPERAQAAAYAWFTDHIEALDRKPSPRAVRALLDRGELEQVADAFQDAFTDGSVTWDRRGEPLVFGKKQTAPQAAYAWFAAQIENLNRWPSPKNVLACLDSGEIEQVSDAFFSAFRGD